MSTVEQIEAVEVYWRPSCPFCGSLRRGLARAGVVTRETNIWEDPSAAARVRAVAGGNETVPTVFLGDHALVAPRVSAVLDAIGAFAPHLTPSPSACRESRGPIGRLRRWFTSAAR